VQPVVPKRLHISHLQTVSESRDSANRQGTFLRGVNLEKGFPALERKVIFVVAALRKQLPSGRKTSQASFL